MIETPTVLVLGAGASKPYGYPLGDELVERIVGLTDEGGDIRRLFASDYDVESFHARLLRSDSSSIDDFLESNSDFRTLGKLCIAVALTIRGPQASHQVTPGTHWYKYLWRQLHEGAATIDAFRKNSLRVITYNYDNSFERYLAGVVHNAYPTLTEATEGFVRGLLSEIVPVVHLHGELGRADDEVRRHATPDRFINKPFIEGAAAGLQIIHEEEASEGYERAHEWLGQARRIYLLGFGYHPTNCRRLNIQGSQSANAPRPLGDMAGTALGLGEAELIRAAGLSGIPTQFLRNESCLPFLQRYARFD